MPKKPTGGSVTKRQANPRPGPGAKGKALGRPTKTSAGGPYSATMKKAPPGATKKAGKYLVKSSSTTKGEVRGVIKLLRSGEISKGTAISRLKGGPRAGLPAGNKKKVAKAIRKVR